MNNRSIDHLINDIMVVNSNNYCMLLMANKNTEKPQLLREVRRREDILCAVTYSAPCCLQNLQNKDL